MGKAAWTDSSREIYDRHGIRLVFTVSGKVGRWDFQNFILQWMTFMGLTACAVAFVDKSAQYILPEKDLFNKYKYEEKEITENDIQQSLLGHDNESAPTRGGPLSLNAS